MNCHISDLMNPALSTINKIKITINISGNIVFTMTNIIKIFQFFLRYFRGFRVDTRVLSVLTTNPDIYQTMLDHTE